MTINRTRTLAALGAVAAVAAVPVAAQAGSGSATVTLKGIKFNPKKVTIKKGGSVTFKWADGSVPHNVTPTGKLKFKGHGNTTKGSYTVKFAKAGTYTYTCTIHPGMDGTIVVR